MAQVPMPLPNSQTMPTWKSQPGFQNSPQLLMVNNNNIFEPHDGAGFPMFSLYTLLYTFSLLLLGTQQLDCVFKWFSEHRSCSASIFATQKMRKTQLVAPAVLHCWTRSSGSPPWLEICSIFWESWIHMDLWVDADYCEAIHMQAQASICKPSENKEWESKSHRHIYMTQNLISLPLPSRARPQQSDVSSSDIGTFPHGWRRQSTSAGKGAPEGTTPTCWTMFFAGKWQTWMFLDPDN